ncbi:uncharacterized protein [Cardiocondyla obscurior]|uniref:uncharacterized protein n=1 Tax=Cardiocondyla obscurior TaxID=286306 RepID=UPI00396562E9
MTDQLNVSQLKKRRATLKSSVTRINTFVESVQTLNPLTLSEIEERKNKLESYWVEYEKFQTALEFLEPQEVADRDDFEDKFYKLAAKMRSMLRSPSSSSVSISPSSPAPSTSLIAPAPGMHSVRLPKVDIPKFSGKYEEWCAFHNTFRSMVHSNESLADIHKLHYLRASTIDDAHKVISSLEISEHNYLVAWNLLRERYDNRRMIVQSHLKAMFEIPQMQRESAMDLRRISDGSSRHIQALKAMKLPTDSWDDLLIYLISYKLDAITLKEWRKSLTDDTLPTFKQFINFINRYCQILEATQRNNESSVRHVTTRYHNITRSKTACTAVVRAKCHLCNEEHFIFQCKQFLGLSVSQRIDRARSFKLCLNCLKSSSHVANRCSSGSCKTCARKHNTLLHIASSPVNEHVIKSDTVATASSSRSAVPNPARPVSANVASVNSDCIFLSTAIVSVDSRDGLPCSARILLDSDSQVNLVTKRFVRSLGLAARSVSVSITGIGGKVSHSSEMVQLCIRSHFQSFSFTVDSIVTDRITDSIPGVNLARSAFQIPRNIRLADPGFCTSSEIDILLGAGIFWELICVGQMRPSTAHPTLQKTRLGWILSGSPKNSFPATMTVQSFHTMISDAELHEQVHKFWKLEDLPEFDSPLTMQELQCEQHFCENVSQNEQGRYIVKLPVKERVLNNIGNSRDSALKRFRGIEKRFLKNSELRSHYVAFMQEYIHLGHMKPVDDSSVATNAYYLPHHSVFKDDTKGGKIRVVFDASCKGDSGASLNDALFIGPVIQDSLVSILLRFRVHQYVITSDIVKMYRQVLVHPSQTHLQRILWREDDRSQIQEFELITLTYGTASASYLATRCLLDIANKHENDFPLGSARVKHDFYVDDLLTGGESISDVINMRDEVIQLLRQGCFELGKWRASSPELLRGVVNQASGSLSISQEVNARILGLAWNTDDDTFHFSYQGSKQLRIITKRNILSEVSRLFDPLGLIGPVVVWAKIIMQDLWSAGVDWDESVPQEIHSRWLHFISQLHELNNFKVARCVKANASSDSIQLLGFCDASQRAYGACVYMRTIDRFGNYQTQLLCSKSRIAPLKATSLPRLELAAALLLSQLVDSVKRAVGLSNTPVFLWSDSTITLHWIASQSRKWSTFVANRVGQIQGLTDIGSWRHVASAHNPADLISRGLFPGELKTSQLWWCGPDYLKLPEQQWPVGSVEIREESVPELRAVVASVAVTEIAGINNLFARTSNIHKICRIVAYCLRMSKRNPFKSPNFQISSQESSRALAALCRFVQAQYFSTEYKLLKLNKCVDNGSKLKSLSPFVDGEGLIRVGGRLKNAQVRFDTCHPILLPHGHAITKMIIQSEHQRNLHCGLQATMAFVSQRFWPIGLKSTVKRVLSSCISCFKSKPSFSETVMGELPAPRVTVSRPFSHCGVDYAGPFLLREGKRRNAGRHKAYLALFVCFATKAVHLELVSDLSTESFLATLKRFISRRGRPSICIS